MKKLAEIAACPGLNLEQKFQCDNLGLTLQAALEGGAEPADVLVQRDVYFRAAIGRLKLRLVNAEHGPPAAQLIAYDRPDGAIERLCTYLLVPVTRPLELEAALTASLGVRATVCKRRRLLMSRNTRLHFDEVEGLGTFVEFEAVLGPGDTREDAHAQIARWRTLLGLVEPVPRSYVDLLEERSAR